MEGETRRTLEGVGEDTIATGIRETGPHSFAEIEDETMWSNNCSDKGRTGFAKKRIATRMSTRLNERQKVPSNHTLEREFL